MAFFLASMGVGTVSSVIQGRDRRVQVNITSKSERRRVASVMSFMTFGEMTHLPEGMSSRSNSSSSSSPSLTFFLHGPNDLNFFMSRLGTSFFMVSAETMASE